MSAIPYIATPDSVSVFIEGRMRVVLKEAPQYPALIGALKMYHNPAYEEARDRNYATILEAVDLKTFLVRASYGRVDIGDTEVRLDGRTVTGYIGERLLEMLRKGWNVEPMARFLEKLGDNPNAEVRQDLFKWLEAANLPIFDDGDFLAFKRVAADYTSYADGRVANNVGNIVAMPREECDESRAVTCGRGLHFCSWSYLPRYHAHSGRVVIVKISPTNVVAIPTDYGLSKGRACHYTVNGEANEDEVRTLYDGVPVVTAEPTLTLDELDAAIDAVDNPKMIVADDVETIAEVVDKPVEAVRRWIVGPAKPTKKEIRKAVKKHGVRGAARLFGLPYTTLHGWWKKISG